MTHPVIDISHDPNRLDVDLIHRFLATTYWAQGRTRGAVERTIRHSLCFGAYEGAQQVGFARVITDRTVFAYLADVFVIPERRRRGISKALMRAVVAHPDLQTLTVFLLRTKDAHGLYRQFGFAALPAAEEMMGRYRDANADPEAQP